MKEIKLTQGKVALVDDEDFDFLNQWKWCAHKDGNNFYAVRVDYSNGRANKKFLSMHRVLLGLTDPKIFPDHKDGDGLNNQRYNLRIATPSQNVINSKTSGKDKTSIYRGVSFFTPKTISPLTANLSKVFSKE